MKEVSKSLIYGISGLLISFILAFGLFLKSHIPQDTLLEILNYQLKHNLLLPITVDKIDGNYISSLTLKNVVYHPEGLESPTIKAKKLTLHYSIPTFLIKKGKLLPALKNITVEEMELVLHKDATGTWNLTKGLPQKKGSLSTPELSEGTEIILKNATIHYWDDLGWKKAPLSDRFKESLTQFEGKIRVDNAQHILLSGTGTLESSHSPATVNAYAQFQPFSFGLSFDVEKADLNKWTPYTVPVDFLAIQHDDIRVKGNIRSRPEWTVGTVPIWFDLSFFPTHTTIKFKDTPFILEKVSGEVHLFRGTLSPELISKETHLDLQQSQIHYQELQKNGILSAYGLLSSGLTQTQNFRKDPLSSILSDPPFMILFQNIKGQIQNTPFKSEGYIDLSHDEITLPFTMTTLDLKTLKQLFPFIDPLEVSGSGKNIASLHGKASNPIFSGYFSTKHPTVFGLKPEQLKIGYRFFDKKLGLKVLEGTLFNGTLSGQGTLSFKQERPWVTFQTEAKNLEMQKILPQLPRVSGTSNVKISASGDLKNFHVITEVNSNSAHLYNQSLDAIKSTFNLQNQAPSELSAAIYINKADIPITLSSLISSKNMLDLQLNGQNIPFYDPYPSSTVLNPGALTIHGFANTLLDNTFWKNPEKNIQFGGTLQLENGGLFSRYYDHISVSGKHTQTESSLDSFQAQSQEESIQITGTFKDKHPSELHMLLQNYRIDENPFFNAYIPTSIQPFQSTISGEILLNYTKKTPETRLIEALKVTTNLVFKDTKIQNQPIQSIVIKGEYQDAKAQIQTLQIDHKTSHLALQGQFGPHQILNFTITEGSFINFNEFKIITAPFGKVLGAIQLDGTLSGTIKSPHVQAKFKAENIETQHISLDVVKGKVFIDNTRTTISDLFIKQNQSHYHFNGNWNKNTPSKKHNASDYDMKLTIEKANIDEVLRFGNALYQEIITQQSINGTDADEVTASYVLSDPIFKAVPIVLYDLQKNSALGFYQSIRTKQENQSKLNLTGISQIQSGKISGTIEATGAYHGFPKLSTNLTIDTLKSSYFSTEKAKLQITPIKEKMAYLFQFDNGFLSSNPFEKLLSKGYFTKEGLLAIEKTDIIANNRKNQDLIEGTIPLHAFIGTQNASTPINLNVHLQGDELGVLSIFSPSIQSITNEGTVELHISGPMTAPIVSSTVFDLKNTAITFAQNGFFRYPLYIPSASITIHNNILYVPTSNMHWQYDSKPSDRNTLTIGGTVGLQGLNIVSPNALILNPQLHVEDTALVLNSKLTPYKGSIYASNLSLKGPYIIPLSEQAKHIHMQNIKTANETGPVLKGKILLQNSTVSLSKIKKNKILPSILLDVDLLVGQDMFINGSLIGSGFLAGISADLELEPFKTPIKIEGSLNHLFIKESLVFRDGSVNILNRNFEILQEKDQRFYQTDTTYENTKNYVSFLKSETNTGSQIIPVIHITARTLSEIPQLSTENISDTDPEYYHIVARLEGPINNLNTMAFDIFESQSDQPQSSPVLLSNTYNLSDNNNPSQLETTELLKVLFPEFYTSETFSEDFINAFSENRINLLVKRGVLRPIEKKIAKSVGLYDLKIDYNIGQDILNQNTDSSRVVGLSMIKNLSDQLYVRVKTDLELQSENQGQNEGIDISEIELNYFLLKNLSLNYANIKDEKRDFKPKVSVKFSHDY